MLSDTLTALIGDAAAEPALPVELFEVAELEETCQERWPGIVRQQINRILGFYSISIIFTTP
jgi:hypothetical protein